MTKLAIIPARGGSKRIPGKNIKDFLGKPIIAYSIEAAIQSNLFDEIMVSTDDEHIAEIALKYGASVPFMRSSKASDDYATTMDVIDEVLSEYRNTLNSEYDFVCCIYATSPLIQISKMQEGFQVLKDKQLTSVFPAVAFDYPVWRGFSINEEGKSEMIWPEHVNARSQDLKKVYHDAGQWYWFNTALIKEWEWPYNSGVVILKPEDVQDIDTISDWKLAEMKYRLINDNK